MVAYFKCWHNLWRLHLLAHTKHTRFSLYTLQTINMHVWKQYNGTVPTSVSYQLNDSLAAILEVFSFSLSRNSPKARIPLPPGNHTFNCKRWKINPKKWTGQYIAIWLPDNCPEVVDWSIAIAANPSCLAANQRQAAPVFSRKPTTTPAAVVYDVPCQPYPSCGKYALLTCWPSSIHILGIHAYPQLSIRFMVISSAHAILRE